MILPIQHNALDEMKIQFQIQPGETLLCCAHKDKARMFFVLHADANNQPTEIRFTRPDGSVGQARFGVVCDECQDDPHRKIAGDGAWRGLDVAAGEAYCSGSVQ